MHYDILADTTIDTSATFAGTVVAGLFAVIAALIGAFFTRTQRSEKHAVKQEHEPTHSAVEQLTVEQIRVLQDDNSRLERRNRELENMLWDAGVNPHSGERFERGSSGHSR